MKFLFSLLLGLWANVAVAQTSPCYWSGQLTKCYPTTGIYLENQRSLRLGDTGTNYVQLNAPATVSGLYALTMPPAAPVSNTSALISDTSGVMSWLVVQPAGNYITALTGDVTATGPGSAVATIANFATNRYVDFILGNDATGTGTAVQPWKSLQKACNSVTPSINLVYAIHISGGNNDPDAAPVTCPPNIAIVSDYDLQLKQNLTITGGTLPLNDTVWFQNIILLGTFNWVRNDATEISVYTVNSVFTQPFDFEQQGSGFGVSFLNMFGGYVNGLTLRIGQANLEAVGTISGTINYIDSGSAYFIVTAADIFAADIQLHGGVLAQFSGNIADSGYTLTGTATGSGTPAIMSDSGSIPPTIAGAYTLSLTSPGQYVSYTPTTSANWASVPTTVLGALDVLATSGSVKAQTANTVLAGPTSGGAAVPAFRALVAADIPNLDASKITTGQLAIARGGTGQATANAALNALLPSQGTHSGNVLTTNGTDTSWTAAATGTVTSVAETVPSFLSISGSPVTTSGTLAITYSGTALPVANGGTGLTSGTSGGVPYYSGTGTIASSGLLSANGVVLGGGAGGAPATITDATATHLLHGGSPPSFTAMTSADIPTTISTARTWNDIQTWKAAGGTVAAGAYDASANWTLGVNGGANTHTFFASIINQGGLAATVYNILAGSTGNAALEFGVTGNAVDVAIAEPYQANGFLANDHKSDLDLVTNGHDINFSSGGLAGAGAIGGSMNSSNQWRLGPASGAFSGNKIRGDNQGGSAAAGEVGEEIISVIPPASAVSNVTGTAKTVTSINLTAGDWDITGAIGYQPAASTSVSAFLNSISLTDNTLPGSTTEAAPASGEVRMQWIQTAFVPAGNMDFPLPTSKITTATASTPYYLVSFANFSVSTMKSYGYIRARRLR